MIKTNFGLFSARQKIDLILGDDVTVEIKYEPDNSTIPPSRRPVVLPENIQHDFDKIREYKEKGIKFSYFVFLDEDGHHKKKMSNFNWEALSVNSKKAYLLLYKQS